MGNDFMRGLVLIFICCTGACATLPQGNTTNQILVTFPVTHFEERLPSGSQRAYHSGSQWSASLHTRTMVRKFAKLYDLQQVEAWPIKPIGVYCVAFTTAGNKVTDTFLKVLRQDHRVSIVQPNNSFKGMITRNKPYNDPLVDLQYGTYLTSIEELHTITRGENVTVAVLDSAVDMKHPDLVGQIKKQHLFTRPSSFSGKVHGTAVTGIIGAAADNGEGLVGLAPKADISIFGACEKIGNETICNSFELAKALVSIIEQKTDVLNMSLAGPRDPLIAELLSQAIDQGMIVIAAANAKDPTLNFPANYPGVIATRNDRDIWFANPEALSTQAGGGYQIFYGSSIAAAGLSGMATLLRTQLPAELARQTLSKMLQTTCNAPDLSSDLIKILNHAARC